jgi:hypothetical protein
MTMQVILHERSVKHSRPTFEKVRNSVSCGAYWERDKTHFLLENSNLSFDG